MIVPPVLALPVDLDEDTGTFAELGLAPEVLRAVVDAGYVHPTPIQAQAIPLALEGRDLIGLAQTGTGKTAAFTLPIVNQLLNGPTRPRALVLTPTRELAVQVDESFRKYARYSGLKVLAVYGGVGLEPQTKALRKGIDVVVATPGRLLDHMERQNVVWDDLEVLVLDEADRMLDMGFAPQINRIVADIPKYRQTLLFSATMPPEVEALARKYLRKPHVVQVGRRSMAASGVTHAVYPVPKARKTQLLAELLKQEAMDTRAGLHADEIRRRPRGARSSSWRHRGDGAARRQEPARAHESARRFQGRKDPRARRDRRRAARARRDPGSRT